LVAAESAARVSRPGFAGGISEGGDFRVLNGYWIRNAQLAKYVRNRPNLSNYLNRKGINPIYKPSTSTVH
jgi:hypothetical protein